MGHIATQHHDGNKDGGYGDIWRKKKEIVLSTSSKNCASLSSFQVLSAAQTELSSASLLLKAESLLVFDIAPKKKNSIKNHC